MMKNEKFKEFLCSSTGRIVMIITLYAVLLCILATSINLLGDIGMAVVSLVSIFFGWKALSKIQPNIFLIMPLIGWVIYFVVKLILSVFVGPFVAPFVISKAIVNNIQNNL